MYQTNTWRLKWHILRLYEHFRFFVSVKKDVHRLTCRRTMNSQYCKLVLSEKMYDNFERSQNQAGSYANT